MEMVVVDRGARRDPECVHASHVTQHTLPDIVRVIEGQLVVVSTAVPVPPNPADGESGVIEVVDIVVPQCVVRRVPGPDADTRRMHTPGVRDQTVLDGLMGNQQLVVVRRSQRIAPLVGQSAADLDATGAQVDQFATGHAIVLRAGAEPHRVFTHVSHGAVFDHDLPRADRRNGGSQVDFRLRKESTEINTTGSATFLPNSVRYMNGALVCNLNADNAVLTIYTASGKAIVCKELFTGYNSVSIPKNIANQVVFASIKSGAKTTYHRVVLQ